MIESIQGQIPQTPRLSFDANEVSDEHVPAFLRRAKERHNREVDYDRSNVIDIRNPRATTPITIPVEVEAATVGMIEEVATAPIMEDTNMEQLELSPDRVKPADLTELTVDELIEQQKAVDEAIKAKREAEKKAVIEQIVDVATRFSIPVEDIVEALGGMKIKRKGVPATVKFRDPATGAEWSGRGKEPTWIKGQDREKFRIKD